MRRALVILGLLLVASVASSQVISQTKHVDLSGMKVGRAYRLALRQTFVNPPAADAGALGMIKRSHGESWPYVASLALLGFLWTGERRKWWSR